MRIGPLPGTLSLLCCLNHLGSALSSPLLCCLNHLGSALSSPLRSGFQNRFILHPFCFSKSFGSKNLRDQIPDTRQIIFFPISYFSNHFNFFLRRSKDFVADQPHYHSSGLLLTAAADK